MKTNTILYIHGKGGDPAEAERWREICDGYDMIGVDYAGYLPWIAKNQIKAAYDNAHEKYSGITVIANSIGAYLTMHSLHNCKIEKALFISPILDMEQLICDMMLWAGVSEKQLQLRGEIPTDFGETLSWKYLCYVRDNPVRWTVPTEILYAGHDDLTSLQTVNEWIRRHNAKLTVMENGEHWFHTDEQLAFVDNWIKNVI